MGQSIRQQARARAMEAQAARRRERAEAERRRSVLGVEVAVALGERDEAVHRFEVRAGRALWNLTHDEGLSVVDVADWVPDISAKEVKRLRRMAEAVHSDSASDRNDSDGWANGRIVAR